MKPKPNPNLYTREFPGRFDQLAAIGDFVEQAAQRLEFDARAIYAVQLAVDEACSNIIEHAYGGEDQGNIACSCHIDADALTITLRDSGQPFDPTCIPAPNLDAPLEERDDRGLGLYFMQQLMDEVHFEFEKGSGNTLTLIKRKGP